MIKNYKFDYAIVGRHILYEERLLPGSNKFKAADVNGDKEVDTIDYTLLQAHT